MVRPAVQRLGRPSLEERRRPSARARTAAFSEPPHRLLGPCLWCVLGISSIGCAMDGGQPVLSFTATEFDPVRRSVLSSPRYRIRLRTAACAVLMSWFMMRRSEPCEKRRSKRRGTARGTTPRAVPLRALALCEPTLARFTPARTLAKCQVGFHKCALSMRVNIALATNWHREP